jgi:hypothetical protein
VTPASIALVGNAPPRRDCGAAIDACDAVVRVNRAAGLDAQTGSRVTRLALVNCGGQMREWLQEPAFAGLPALRRAGAVVLPAHPDKDAAMAGRPTAPAQNADGANYAPQAQARLRAAGKRAHILRPGVFVAAWRVIGAPPLAPGMAAPSTGLLALVWLLGLRGRPTIHLWGFAFDGWRGHDWPRERAFVEDQARRGRVVWHGA